MVYIFVISVKFYIEIIYQLYKKKVKIENSKVELEEQE